MYDGYCIVEFLRRKYNPMPNIHIMYEDQPHSDFKSLFMMTNGEYIKQVVPCVWIVNMKPAFTVDLGQGWAD